MAEGKLSLEIASLNTHLEPIFWKHVNQDILHYFFFAFDWKCNREETKILLALKEKKVEGMMLVFRKSIAQLRGSLEAAEALLEHLDLEKVELQVAKEHKEYILEKYESEWSHELVLMVLHRGEETLQISHPTVKLDASDAEQIVAIMNDADTEFWRDIKVDQIVEGMSSDNWVGIKVNGELVSIGRTRITQGIGHIVTIATDEAHRNKGYATSIVSHSVKSILQRVPTAIIYVLSDNPPAIRVYKKAGFSPYKTYFFMRGRRR